MITFIIVYCDFPSLCTVKARSANARALFSYEIVLQKHARAFSLLAFDGAKTWKITVDSIDYVTGIGNTRMRSIGTPCYGLDLGNALTTG